MVYYGCIICIVLEIGVMKKNVLKIMLGSIIIEALLICLFILTGELDEIAVRALASIGIIIGYSIPCLFYSKIYDNEKYKYIAISGSVIVCISALMDILNLWNLFTRGEFLSNMMKTFDVVIYMLVFISWILSFVSVNNLLNLFKKISILLILLLSFSQTIIIWMGKFPEGFLARLYFVLIILTISSFICTLILTRVYKKEMDKMGQSEQKNRFTDNQVMQNNFMKYENEQTKKEVPIQSQNTTQSMINPSQTINYSENIQQASSTTDELSNNNESDNNVL